MSSKLDAPVNIGNVVPTAAVYLPGPAIIHMSAENLLLQHRDLLINAGHLVVEGASNQVRNEGGKVGAVEVIVGDPANEIVAFAGRHDGDCIIMGRRGLGNVSGMFAGSGHSQSRAHCQDDRDDDCLKFRTPIPSP